MPPIRAPVNLGSLEFLAWRVTDGAVVREGEGIAEVIFEVHPEVVVELPAPLSGRVYLLAIAPGSVVAAGQEMGRIEPVDA